MWPGTHGIIKVFHVQWSMKNIRKGYTQVLEPYKKKQPKVANEDKKK